MEGQDVRTVLSGSKLFWGPFLAQLRVKLSFPADSNWLKCIPLVSLYVSHIMFPPYPENETIASGTVNPINKVVTTKLSLLFHPNNRYWHYWPFDFRYSAQ